MHHGFGPATITNFMYGKRNMSPLTGHVQTIELERYWKSEVMRITCGSECCFWLRRFFRVSAVPPRTCLGSCIPYTCLFGNYLPYDDKQLEIVGGVNELMNYELIYQLNAIEYLLCTFSSTCFGLTRPSSGAMDFKFLYIYSIWCPWCS